MRPLLLDTIPSIQGQRQECASLRPEDAEYFIIKGSCQEVRCMWTWAMETSGCLLHALSQHAPFPTLRLFMRPAVAPFKTSANRAIGRNIWSRDSVTPVTEQDNERFKNGSIRSWKTSKHIISR